LNAINGDTFVYLWPVTGLRVQGWVPDDPMADKDTYVGVKCIACGQVHLVNRPAKVVGGV
jgi:hypothetical protein